jgi:hypothetical protein
MDLFQESPINGGSRYLVSSLHLSGDKGASAAYSAGPTLVEPSRNIDVGVVPGVATRTERPKTSNWKRRFDLVE